MQTVTVRVRVRWIAIAVLFVFAVVALYGASRVSGGVDSMVGIARRISFGALFALGFWSASHVLQKWMSHPVRPLYPTVSGAPPVARFAPAPMPIPVGPGHYRVTGTDRETHFQTTEIVYADSPDNARLKVELKGVKVAEVEMMGKQEVRNQGH